MAQFSINLEIADEYLDTFRWGLETFHLSEADTSGNGTVSNAEGIAWFTKNTQTALQTFLSRFMMAAESQNPSVLPVLHQSALTTKNTAETNLEAERAKAIVTS